MITDSEGSGSSLSLAPEQNAVRGSSGRRRETRIPGDSCHGMVQDDGSTRDGRTELDTAIRFAERIETSSSSGSLGRNDACETCSSEIVWIVVMGEAGFGIRQEEVLPKCNEYARPGSPEYGVAHRKSVRNKAEEGITLELVKSLPAQAVTEMVASKMDDVVVRRSTQGTKKSSQKRFFYRRVFCEDEMLECIVPKKLELTDGERLRVKQVREEVTLYDVEKQVAIAILRSIQNTTTCWRPRVEIKIKLGAVTVVVERQPSEPGRKV